MSGAVPAKPSVMFGRATPAPRTLASERKAAVVWAANSVRWFAPSVIGDWNGSRTVTTSPVWRAELEPKSGGVIVSPLRAAATEPKEPPELVHHTDPSGNHPLFVKSMGWFPP